MAVTNQTISTLSTALFTDTANSSTIVAVKASSATVSYIYADNSTNGPVFGTALSCASTTAGGTAGAVAPSTAITVRIAYS